MCTLVATSVFSPWEARGQKRPALENIPECSLAKTNKSCRLTIDRNNPITPPTIQVYSNQILTVIVKNPKEFERYFLDYQSGQATLVPDVASAIVQGLVPSLGNIKGLWAARTAPPIAPPPEDPCGALTKMKIPEVGHLSESIPSFQTCVMDLSTKAIAIYRSLEPWIAPDSIVPSRAETKGLSKLQEDIRGFLASEFALSGKITTISNDSKLKSSDPDAPAMLDLANLQKSADAVANDLMGYSQRITDLNDMGLKQAQGFQACKDLIEVSASEEEMKCVILTSRRDDDRVYENMVTRTITYSLNTLNLLSNSQQAALDPTKKKLLASITVNFADKPVGRESKYSALRWEASAGVFFSTLAIRSFSAAPVFTNGVITDNTVHQNVLHPTVVPFAAANYRLSNYFHTRWNSALYWTGAVGVNPNTVSADFASGLSVSWRALMVSALWHYGHDVRLAQGLQVNQSLGASFSGTLPTQTYWTSSFAVGLSVRIPSLTGR